MYLNIALTGVHYVCNVSWSNWEWNVCSWGWVECVPVAWCTRITWLQLSPVLVHTTHWCPRHCGWVTAPSSRCPCLMTSSTWVVLTEWFVPISCYVTVWLDEPSTSPLVSLMMTSLHRQPMSWYDVTHTVVVMVMQVLDCLLCSVSLIDMLAWDQPVTD